MHDEILSAEGEWGAPYYYGDQGADPFTFLAGKLVKGDTYPLAIKVLDHASSVSIAPLDKHLLLDSAIRMLYREREKPAALSAAIDACRQHIDTSPQAAAAWPKRFPKIPPDSGSSLGTHRGYKQLKAGT
jgi:hypothetical protein